MFGHKEAPKKNSKKEVEQPSALGLIHRKLYAKEESTDILQRQEALKRLGIKKHAQGDLEESGDTLKDTKFRNLALLRAKRTGRLLRFSVILIVAIFVVVWAVVLTVWYRSSFDVGDDQVVMTIEVADEFTAGEEIIYNVNYKNDSRVDWEKVELLFSPPRGFNFRGSNLEELEESGKQLVFKLGRIKSGETGEVHVRGQLIGEQNEAALATAEIVLTPENFPSGRFSKSVVKATTITALPLEVGLGIPQDAANGERVVATVSMRNLSSHALDGVYLSLDPAPNVQLATDDVDFTPEWQGIGSRWVLSTLPSLGTKDFTFVFYVAGTPGERRNIGVEAGIVLDGEDFVQRALSHVINVSASEVVIEQLHNGSAEPIVARTGETISGEVKYQNVGTVGLKDVIIELTFQGVAFDPESLELNGVGSYDPLQRKVVWSAATVPDLAVVQPQQTGSIPYSFRILPTERFPLIGANASNNLVVTTATVDSPDLPAPVGQPKKVVSDRAVISIGTALLLEAISFYDDGRLGLESDGPVPPEVGKETTYTLRWRVGTTLNDVSQIRLSATLPDGVSYTGQSYQTGGEFSVNDRSGEIIWTLPFLAGLSGRAKPGEELHLQVAITPGEDKLGEEVVFLNRLRLDATDQFTDQPVEAVATSYPSTGTANPGQGGVVR